MLNVARNGRFQRRTKDGGLRPALPEGALTYPTTPPRVDYELTPQGRSLHDRLLTLANWARSQQGYIAASRRAFDGRTAEWAVPCLNAGEAPKVLHSPQLPLIYAIGRLARTCSSPTGSGPEGSSPNETFTGRCQPPTC